MASTEAPHVPTHAPPPGSPCSYCTQKRPGNLQLAGVARVDERGLISYETRAICSECLITAFDTLLRPKVQVVQ